MRLKVISGCGLAESTFLSHEPAVKSLLLLRSPGDKLIQLLPTDTPRISPVGGIRSSVGENLKWTL